jgi:hypothetical protein
MIKKKSLEFICLVGLDLPSWKIKVELLRLAESRGEAIVVVWDGSREETAFKLAGVV